ncbi:MAG: hypothetical protein AVDCRST_MAG02-2086 [uncultured Rubrobacteraceae bacterium]|uniref:DUF2188 domain-containing protein n=1 Tax=uncultured Rubrobacteraceae bacterium TaxID=349277 RepID=A0A6J4R1D1_9ACTN|nr:MAG: hypothetical protein AVDCRST_MAG02-2086 [uncultured Rubrobacteraceae bacterium]
MGARKHSGAEEASDKAPGRAAETAGRMQGDKTLEAEGRAARRIGKRTTYCVSAHDDGGWKVRAEGAGRSTSVHKTEGEALANAKGLARSRRPSQMLVYKQDGTVRTGQTFG